MATALEPRPRRFTVEEYLRMGESGILLPDERVELIEGEIIQMTPIGSPHAGTVAHLLTLLVRGAGERAVVWPQNPLHLGDRSMPQPDLILLKPRPTFYTDAHPIGDDVLLLIEVADSSIRYDHLRKLPLYARFGVPECWIVNLQEACIEAYHTPYKEGYREFRRYVAGERISPQALPDLVIEVGALLVAEAGV
jgi:Uma2 family endonuclease